MDAGEEVESGELDVCGVEAPLGFDAEPVTVLKPEGELFDGGVFEVGGEGRLAGTRCGAGRM